MDLSTTQQVLVIILASALAVFIIQAIIIATLLIRLLIAVRRVANKAEKIVESAEAVGDVFRKATGPLNVFRFVHGIMNAVSKHKSDNDKEE
jgi:hypothetical protein